MRRSVASLILAALGLAACAPAIAPQEPPAASAQTMLTTTATVLAVDPEARTLDLRDARTGEAFSVRADAAAGDLGAITPGDVIMLDYFASYTLAPAPAGDAGTPVTLTEEASPAATDGPGGVAVGTTSLVVDFLGHDDTANEALVRDPDGATRRIGLTPPLAEFVRGLAPGDRVLVTLTEVIALSVTPAD
jgi:hypothetical protein